MRTQPLLETLDLAEFERVVVLSPHLDDAALSCGGLLGLLEGQISRLVITLSCANPPPKLKPNGTSARSRNRRGFASPAERRREDRAAMQSIRCDFVHLGFSDCIYRRSPTSGELIYKKPREILTSGRLCLEDGAHVEELYLVLRRLCLGMGRLLLLSPLGIGHHIDHVICANVAARLASERARVLFYEDFPYVLYGDSSYPAQVPRMQGSPDSPESALARIHYTPSKRLSVKIPVEDKARLLLHYKSQIEVLFGSEREMRRMLEHRRFEGKPAEFFWFAQPRRTPVAGEEGA